MPPFRLLVATCCLIVAGLSPAHANDFAIVNGSEAAASDYPWLVSIDYNGYSTSNAFASHNCGGSLIHPQWVLTAAHCLVDYQASDLTVTLGRHRLSDSNSGQRVAVSQLLVHPAYNPDDNDNDLGLVQLAQPVSGIAVLRLAPPALPIVGKSSRAIGWGALASPLDSLMDKYPGKSDCYSSIRSCLTEIQTKYHPSDAQIISTLLLANGLSDVTKGIGYSQLLAYLTQLGGSPAAVSDSGSDVASLVTLIEAHGGTLSRMVSLIAVQAEISDTVQQVDLPVVDNATCARASTTYRSITNNMFCAGYRNQPKDTCYGDSGGPILLQNSQGTGWVQIGLVSFGVTCATNYGVNTRVANYLDWLAQTVPHLNEDRIFNWGEVTAAGYFKPSGCTLLPS
jgi:secreted trypsin-like serine protease